jgi:hypothetical protein
MKSPAVSCDAPWDTHFVGIWLFIGDESLLPNADSADSVWMMYESALQRPCCSKNLLKYIPTREMRRRTWFIFDLEWIAQKICKDINCFIWVQQVSTEFLRERIRRQISTTGWSYSLCWARWSSRIKRLYGIRRVGQT